MYGHKNLKPWNTDKWVLPDCIDQMYQPGPALLGPQIENLRDTVLRHHGLLESDNESCAESYMAGHPDRPETFEPTVTLNESTGQSQARYRSRYITRELMAMVTKLKKPQATGTTLGKIIGAKEEDSNFALPVPAEDDAKSTERKANKFSEHIRKADGASNFRLRAVLMGQLSDKARRASGWPLLSPVRWMQQDQPSLPVSRGRYQDIRREASNTRHRNDFKTTIQNRKTDGTRLVLPLSIGKDDCEALRLPEQIQVFLVVEIMHEGKSRDIPWVPCPSVGPYDNFEVLSSLGVRVEYRERLRQVVLDPTPVCAASRQLEQVNGSQQHSGHHPAVPKGDEGFHRELAAQQQYLNELPQTDPSERIDWPRPVIPQPHDVLNYFFEQSFDERIALKHYMKAAKEPKLLPIFGVTRQGGHPTRNVHLIPCCLALTVRADRSSRPDSDRKATTRSSVATVPMTSSERLSSFVFNPGLNPDAPSKPPVVDESSPELRFRAVLSTSEDMTIPLKLSCSHIFDMIRTLRPVEAAPYDRFLLGEGPPFRINLDRDMLRIFDNALPRYRSNDGYRAAIPVRRILSYIHNMPTVVFRTTSNPGDPNNAIHPFHPNNPIDPDDDDFLDELYGDDHLAAFRPAPTFVRVPPFTRHLDIDHLPRLEDFNLVTPVAKRSQWIIPGLKRLGPSIKDDDEHEQRGLQAHTAIKWQCNFHRYFEETQTVYFNLHPRQRSSLWRSDLTAKMEKKLFSTAIIHNLSHVSGLFAKVKLNDPNKGNMTG
ncbi:uncharacterized protein B0J16DRAFT_321220 [Fusarium flagelliforme]|uniref:uncharacterized protein n=1 Tax=Fusarium flagelliforme TaxID=2675880 RepID=UPI001E8E5A44|nr:uncharacterized protein B0J16DRAFT_321220 [Fusarium flagelliforme]KAH7182438.1 hypothetical protein B0J16DRAFT_321220 [Fusarium flagelliforme]